MKNLLNEIFSNNEFISANENFLSEKDFQFYLANMLEKAGCENVILEYPKEMDHLTYIDIYCEYKQKKCFFELKYKTKKAEVIRHGEKFSLKNHAAHPYNRYYVYKDIERMEKVVSENKEERIGYVVFLTNDNNYWDKDAKICPLCKKTSGTIEPIKGKFLEIKQQYEIQWQDFKNHEPFKYLLIEVK